MLAMKKDLTHDIEGLSRNIELVKKDLTIRLGGMMAVSVSILGVLISILNRTH